MSRHLLQEAKALIETLAKECHIITAEDGPIESLLAGLQRELDVGRKYATGNYLILRFDDFGSKIATVLADESGLIRSQAQAQHEIQGGMCASAVVVQVLWNSKDRQAERWEVK